jgi:hypothetical protein
MTVSIQAEILRPYSKEEGKSDEDLHLTLKLKDLKPGAENGILDAYFLIGTGHGGKKPFLTALPAQQPCHGISQ